MSLKIIIAVLSTASCGSPFEEATIHVAQAAEGAKSALDDTIDGACDWIEEPQLEQREHECRKEGGEWVKHLKVSACKDGWAELCADDEVQQQPCVDGQGFDDEYQCVHRNAEGFIYFNDGPSHPVWIQAASARMDVSWDVGRWNTLFWRAGVNHDYCYHHNGATRGFTQKQCDEQMLSDLSAVCCQEGFRKIPWFTEDLCRSHAAAMFAAVRGMGESAFTAMNTRVEYPEWQPLWQAFGMEHEVMDEKLVERVDEFVEMMP